MIEILSKWNFWNLDVDTGILRRRYLDKLLKFVRTDKIISIIGIRRSGKSTLIRQLAKELIKRGISRNDTLIINFEEPEFEGADLEFLQKAYEAYSEIIKPKEKPFVFLDEIQNVGKWEKFVRSLNERKEAFLIVSGSSSKLLSRELATVLTGRQLYFEIWPLSFSEFLSFENVEIKEQRDILLNSLKIKKLFRDYMEFGGFPEVVLNKDSEFKIKTLRSYYEDIINRDIVRRFKIKKIDQLRALARFYLTNVSSLISFNKVSEFIQLPVETVRRFSSYLEESSIIFFIKRFSFSVKEQEKSSRKVYSADVGLSNNIGFRFSENFGKLAENIIAIELKRAVAENPNLEIYYWKDYQQREVDFIIKEGLNVKQLIQVCWDIDEYKTKEREIKSLLKCMQALNLREGIVITEDFEGEEKLKGKKIIFKPLWKWILKC